ncbi:sialoadhesin-like [Carassius carassius]|uniref:sialoadhesin-like n=1 Tax=Carassius carassius TaxID=217509 RepID=UPI002868A789|nr:sialoadhesin-like [Carassius carassius]
MFVEARVDGQQYLAVNYGSSYVCALKGSTVKLSCVLNYPHDHELRTVFWTKPAVTDGDPPNLCLDPENRGGVQCDREYKDTHSITLMNVTEADKHIYYCRFTTNRGRWTGIPGAQLDVTDLQVETEQSVKETDSVNLTCKSSCSLPQQTTFIWFRNTERLTTGIITENQLQLRSVSRDDSGNYQCTVSGEEHLISPPVYLQVGWVDGQQYLAVNYGSSYVCALKGSSVKFSCVLNYPHDHELKTVFWTKPAVTDGDPPNLCLDPENRGGVQCDSEYKDTHSISLTSVTEADKHIYYCRFTTNRGRWTGIPGARLDVTDLQVETEQSVKEKDSVALTCKSSCSLPQQTTFIWFRNTQILTEESREMLYLPSVTSSDSGNYQCAVSGEEHLISPPVYLKVGSGDCLQDWRVNYSSSYVCALKGSTVKLSCTLKYPPDHQLKKVFWTKPAVTDGDPPNLCSDPENRGRVQCVREYKDTYRITLTNVTEADKHIYYCKFTTETQGGKWTGVPGAQLDVTDLQVETEQSVKETDSVNLTCKSSCSLPQQTTFIWFRNTQRLTTGIITVNQLQLRSVSLHDSGNYQCTVSGEEHLISPPVYLQVGWVDGQQYLAVNYGSSYVCALKGSTVKLSCVLNYPHDHELRTVFWTKPAVTDGEPPNLCLDPENRGGVQCDSEYKDTHSITLMNVTEADKHIYYCRFTTNRGRWTGIPGAQLDVTDLQVETEQSVKETDSVNLTCKSSCSLPQQTTFIWFRNTQRLTTGIITENQLQLRSVSRDDSGNYQCAVSGEEHLISPPVFLKVRSGDGQQDWGVNYSSSYVCALKGSTVKLSCTLKYPPDHQLKKLFWTKPAVSVTETPDLCLVPEKRGRVQCVSEYKDTYRITLTNVTEADKHIYNCRFTTNTEGGRWTGVPGAQLDVTDLQVETEQSVKETDSVNLTCKSSCSLPQQTTFIWFRNTQILTTGIITENQLQLRSVSRDDSGNYQCAVSGEEHLKSKPVYLQVGWVDGQQYLPVNYGPSYVCALKGSTVKLSCVLNYPHDHELKTVFWTKPAVTDGDPPNLCLDPENRGGVQCDSEYKDTHSITLMNVTEADKHIYYCRFTTNRGRWIGIPGAQLDVTDLQVETEQSVKETDSVALTCKSSCSLPQQTTFIWFRNTQILTTGIITENQLQLRSVSRHDSGNYQCAVSGEEHLISPPVYLKVRSGDCLQDWGVNYSSSYVCALKGSTVKLSCTVKYPHNHHLKKVFWTKPAVAVTETPDLCLVPEKRGRVQCVCEYKDTYRITLTNVTEADKHIYNCRFTTKTENGRWTGVPGAQLDVTDLQVETEQSVKETDSVALTCKSSCSLPQQTTFIWFRNTERLTTGIITENQLQLRSVSLHDSGNYQCAVSGEEHLISPPVYLQVGYTPQNTSVSISPSGEIVEGDSVTLICSSDSNPPALNFSWFKENQSSAVGSGQSFIISSFNSSHSGRYYCEAQNQHGSQRSASVSVSVKGDWDILYIIAVCVTSAITVGCGLLFLIIIIVHKRTKKRNNDYKDTEQDKVSRLDAAL